MVPEALCVVIGDRPFDAIGCAIPAPLPGKLLAGFDDVYVPRAFVFAVPAQVATLRFASDGRVALTLPAIEAAGYAGRYAGAVRRGRAVCPQPPAGGPRAAGRGRAGSPA